MSTSAESKFTSAEMDADEMPCTLPEIQESAMDIKEEIFEDTDDRSCTSPEIQETSLSSLPEASRKSYLCVYENFIQWKMARNTESLSESVLLVYFTELASKYKPSTLWTTYSMLRSTIHLNHGINIERYFKLRAFLKSKSKGFRPKKASTFSTENINEFLTEASDQKFLATKVALIMGVVGACRANEMYEMKMTHLKDLGSAFLVKVPTTKTKVSREFTITDNYYEICKKYISLRPRDVISNVLFLNFQNGKCTNQRIGINKFTKMGKQIAEYLKLPHPERFSGLSFRRSTSTILVNAGGVITSLKRTSGWKSTTEAEGYIDEPFENKIETDEKISISVQNPIGENNEIISTNSSSCNINTGSSSCKINSGPSSYNINTDSSSSCNINTNSSSCNINITSSSNSVPVINIENCVNTNITININK
ncbi:uncharacterized protein LOC123306444 [Coccinella septempunctata]|uniref:uncharacterized protein LOC123306444 n=1 Tax=Coccinella septempunctata TaxID=41139 RepID=UPI001D087D80|nr:uncharacterized protein LOC123306444 [Coccinella septempunctata]